MKTILIAFLLSALGLAAQDRYVTVTLPVVKGVNPNDISQIVLLKVTNTLEIVSGETAHLISLIQSADTSYLESVYIEKNGVSASVSSYGPRSFYSPMTDSLVVNGPAKLSVVGMGGGMATFKITPDQYPPDRTVVVPGGPGGATVTMECSTNLTHWAPAESGVYTNLPGVKFFRIKLDRVQP